MARLNEPPVSLDNLETLRKKMLRQNRDLAKSNNIRALRIRELENECACMLSENLELRGRILELEKQAQDSDARRIADHALAIKAKLESQLTEWGTLLAGLGLEPPIKRHSPRISKSVKQRMSFSTSRPSPSQRRLRDVARDIEDLGYISENKSCPRKTLNSQQILALRSEADSADSPELGPPPMSKFIDEDPVKVDTPSRYATLGAQLLSPKSNIAPPVPPASLKIEQTKESPAPAISPEVKTEPITRQEPCSQPDTSADTTASQPLKTGSKRKLAARDHAENVPTQRIASGDQVLRAITEKQSLREKADGKTLKELASIRKEKRAQVVNARRPLAAKSINSDIGSPKKSSKPAVVDEAAADKVALARSKASSERCRPKTKSNQPVNIDTVPVPDIPPPTTTELAISLVEPALLSPSSPEPVTGDNTHRGDTPPPTDISSRGETSRPGRRNRTAISYTEPNLRDKMRRPTKELFDAVAGEGKYSRRSSHTEPSTFEVKREHDAGASAKRTPATSTQLPNPEPEPGSIPASPLARKSSSPQDLPNTVVTERRRRPSSISSRATELVEDRTRKGADDKKPEDVDINPDTSEPGDVDIYEFTSSSPQVGPEISETKTRRRKTTSSRRLPTAVDSDQGPEVREGNPSSRRRSMVV